MNGAKTFFFMLLLTALLVLVGGAFDLAFGGGGRYMRIFAVFAIGMNFFTYWFADMIVLKMHKAKPTTPEEAPQLHAMIDRLCAKAGLPKPKVCIVPSDIPNAFATGRNRSHSAVAVTQGLMRALNEDELEGVVAHELAHIKHYDMLLQTVVASFAAVIAIFGSQARWGMLLGGGRRDNNNPLAIVGLLFVAIIAPLLAVIVRSLISHQREFAADAGGAGMTGNPVGLASALRTIERQALGMRQPQEIGPQATSHMYFVNHFSMGRGAGRAAMKFMSTHPPTEERIERLLAMAERGRA